MYHTPLAVYREYIQNAADAIEGSPWSDEGRVDISIDAGQRKVTVRDNGPGLTHAQAKRDLIPIARSRKRRGVDRGFRGIGRLSGLAFAEAVTFRTRSRATQAVTEVKRDGATLRASIAAAEDPREIIEKYVNVSKAKDLGVRGIRLREGNIQIGDENALDTLFREERFNRWCVGEIHVVDARLLPNGRHDYFEPSPHMRQIENHLESIIRSLVHRCRNASSARNQQRKLQTTLDHMDSAYELAGSGYLEAADAKALIEKMMERVPTLEESLDPTDPDHEVDATRSFSHRKTHFDAATERPSPLS